MNRWRSMVLSALAAILLGGCVYVPPYYSYDAFDPVSPRPWYYPVDPYPPRYRYYRIPGERFRYSHRYMGESGDPYIDEGYGPLPGETRRYRRGDSERRELDDAGELIPPSAMDVPAREKGSSSKEDSKDIPTATKGSRSGRVKIPFPPYSELDVSGMPSGSLAKDPTSGRIFRIP
jgi:hypothetical protein